jgi:16S rRNA (cytosine1402-N4)-methyltransferase
MTGHVPVMLAEAIAALDPKPGETHVDATFGGGGYARALLEAGADVIAVDRDPAAIERANALAAQFRGRLKVCAGPFGELPAMISGPVDGVVFDLGVSSFQLDEAARGFSFRFDAALDMRMSARGATAADAVNALSEAALAEAIYAYGEEPASRRIARALVAARPIETTRALADVVERALGGRKGARVHPATRTFQALRMLVNDELGELARGLCGAERLLKPGGRLVTVAFHSLEDRLVKAFFAARDGRAAPASRHRPMLEVPAEPVFLPMNRRAAAPGQPESADNARARSAKLRAAVRTAAPAAAGAAWTDPATRARAEWEGL